MLRQLASVVFGITVGLGVNAVSTDLPGYRARPAAAAVAASLAGAYWLRQYSPRTWLVRVGSWTLLGGAAVAAVVGAVAGTVLGHRSWEGGAGLGAPPPASLKAASGTPASSTRAAPVNRR